MHGHLSLNARGRRALPTADWPGGGARIAGDAAWYEPRVKQRVLFGRVASGGRPRFVVPSFGRCCVCCNADASGRLQACDPSTEELTATPVEMPVCIECKDHAIGSALAPRLQALLLTIGLVLVAVGALYLCQRPEDRFLWGMLAVGGAMIASGALWLRATVRRDRRERVAGHHARLMFSVGYGRMLLDTTNEELVRELVARNATARVLAEPPLWRWQRRRQMPVARVVRSREP